MIIREQVPVYVDALWNGSLAQYFAAFAHSRLPFGIGIAGLAWFALFVANFVVARRVVAVSDAQTVVVVDGTPTIRRGFLPHWVVAQFAVAAITFAASTLLGSAGLAFFGGGQLVLVSGIVGNNIQSLLSISLMARANAVEGQLKISAATTHRQVAYRMLGATVFCVLLALLLAHLAPLGGALWLGSTAIGHFRRARQADARALQASSSA